jgi:hypothetical protein
MALKLITDTKVWNAAAYKANEGDNSIYFTTLYISLLL